jgi:hypothetical protein
MLFLCTNKLQIVGQDQGIDAAFVTFFPYILLPSLYSQCVIVSRIRCPYIAGGAHQETPIGDLIRSIFTGKNRLPHSLP